MVVCILWMLLPIIFYAVTLFFIYVVALADFFFLTMQRISGCG